MNKEAIQKIKGHTEHIVDRFLRCVERYDLVDPIMFNHETVERIGRADRGRPLDLIRRDLYFSILHDIANICFDRQPKTPSLTKIIKTLKDRNVQNALRKEFSKRAIQFESQDPIFAPAMEKFQKEHELELSEVFDAHLKSLFVRWDRFNSNPRSKALKNIRNRFTAHFDLEKKDGKYRAAQIKTFGLQWSDLKMSMASLIGIIKRLDLIARAIDNYFDDFIRDSRKQGEKFWQLQPYEAASSMGQDLESKSMLSV